jgi:uncharacterized protein (TIGR02145 family)
MCHCSIKMIISPRSIPRVIATVIFISMVCSCKTSNPIHSPGINSTQPDSLVTDSDGNKYPVKVLLDGKLWMTANLDVNIPNSYCYENVKENCQQYGRLYTWESATGGCKLLGEGWRLPVSVEWQQLTMLYGGAAQDSNVTRKDAYKSLPYGGGSGFNALLGGGRAPDCQYARLDAHGFYWTATEGDSSTAWFYNFAKGSQALYQQDGGEKLRAFSVRCVKTIDSLK